MAQQGTRLQKQNNLQMFIQIFSPTDEHSHLASSTVSEAECKTVHVTKLWEEKKNLKDINEYGSRTFIHN